MRRTGRLGDIGQSKTRQKKFTAEQIYLLAALFCFYAQRQCTAPRGLNGADALMQIQYNYKSDTHSRDNKSKKGKGHKAHLVRNSKT